MQRLDLSLGNYKDLHFYICNYKNGKFSHEEFKDTFLTNRITKINVLDSLKEGLKAAGKSYNENHKNIVIILLVPMREMHLKELYYNITQEMIISHIQKNKNFKYTFRPTNSDFQTHNKFDKERIQFPIILISDDVINYESNDSNFPNYKNIINQLNLDPRVLYWDSSIWNRFITYDCNFVENLKSTLDDILIYYEQDLYNACICKEFIEFETRKMLNSFLTDFSRHAQVVYPYKFHSESAIKGIASKSYNQLQKQSIKWRVLLIDDYADVCLAGTQKKKEKHNPSNSKLAILHKLINCDEDNILCEIFTPTLRTIEYYNQKNKKNWPECEGDCSYEDNVLTKVFRLITEGFDVFLLDYLLGEGDGKRELGTDFLNKIREFDQEELKLPMNKFWIFPISAFSYAMFDEFREKGLSHHNKQWELASGNDPVNTPHLFRYKFFKFLQEQINDSGLRVKRLIKSCKKEIMSLPFHEVDYNRLTERLFVELNLNYAKYKQLKRLKDLQENDNSYTCFASSVVNQYNEIIPEQVWEHLLHLMYLLAFGSKMHWEEMWEEANFVSTILQNNNLNGSSLDTIIDELKKYIRNIRDK